MVANTNNAAAQTEPLCLQFVNTVDWRIGPRPEEGLHDLAGVIRWGSLVGALPPGEAEGLARVAAADPERAAATYARAIALREALYRLFMAAVDGKAPEPTDLALFNAALSRALAKQQLAIEGGAFTWAWAEAEGDLERVLWPVLRSAAELLTSDRLARVRQCADEACGWLFVDESRNRSRRWCNMADCGNRAKARRHYRRQRAVQGH